MTTTKNLFRLFDTDPNWREAEAKLKAACEKAAVEIVALQDHYEHCGAGDTDSRDAIIDHIWHLLLYPPDKRARDIELVRQLVIEGKDLKELAKSLNWSVTELAKSLNWKQRYLIVFRVSPGVRLLRKMDDAELVATLKVDPGMLPGLRDQISQLNEWLKNGEACDYEKVCALLRAWRTK